MGFLTSQLGIRMVLWTGSTVPTPAPPEALNALTRAEVNNDIDSGDGFQLTFTLAKGALQDYTLLRSGAVDMNNRVIIAVVLGLVPEVLIDGVITHHQINPGSEPGQATLTVTGKDVSQMMDREERNAEYPNQPDSVIFAQIVARYAQFGLVPVPTMTSDIPIEITRTPRQQETDLAFVRRMASRNGFVFYVEPVTFGVNQAYFGPESRAGLPQPALTMNMGAHSNLKTLSFSNDATAGTGTSATIQEPITRMNIPIPSLPSLRLPPFAASPTAPVRKTILRETANQNPGQAASTVVGAVSTAPEAVTGNGELETVRYGAVLRARKPVGVRGMGTSYDGFYYVRKVKHVIARNEYTQQFSISREGTGALLPVVRP
jgi:hypothetical protein